MYPTALVPPKFTNSIKLLSDKQSGALKDYLESRGAGHCFFRPDELDDSNDSYTWEQLREFIHSSEHHSHDHHHKEKSIITAIAAGLVNYVLMFGFCCAYGMIIFMDAGHKQHRGLGINMALGTATLLGFLLAINSKVPIAIGGPDMNPVIFVGVYVTKISEELCSQMSLSADGSISSSSRRLGSQGPVKDFCTGAHYDAYQTDCDEYHKTLRATVIFAVTVSSGILAVVLILLGGFKLTRYVAYVPTSIVDAFLSCMGYKVFKHGLKLCKYEPRQFIPAAAVGVPLYFFKALHIGNPMYVIPAFLMTPLVFFYVLVYATGWDIDMAREDKWMFEEVYHENFWTVWSDGIFNHKYINLKAWSETWVDILIMVIVCVLDCLVTALRTTEAKIPVKMPEQKMNFETQLYGAGNFIAGLAGSTPGYMQLKLNVVNYGIMGNVEDRSSGIIYALMCASSFFGTIAHLNFLPRIFLGMLLFFGGSGFVAEHLWGSKEYLSVIEWIQVFLILTVFIISDDIVYAVLFGGVMCGLTFIAKYAKIPCIAGRPMKGGELQSREQHNPWLSISLSHISNSWVLVIRLKGYVFFASVQSVTKHVREIMEKEILFELPEYRRIKFVVFDCELLDGLDTSAEKDIQQLCKDTKAHKINILWSNVKPTLAKHMLTRGTIASKDDWFIDLDDTLLYIEGICLHYRKHQQALWEELHPAFALRTQLMHLRESYEPFLDILRLDIERFGCPWDYCTTFKIRTCSTILWTPNEHDCELFLVHTGAVGLFHSIPDKDGNGPVARPLAVYRHGWFLNREFLMQAPTRHYAVTLEDGEVLQWNAHEWWRMHREYPLMVSAMIEAAMRQASCDMERVGKALRSSASATITDAQCSSLARPRDMRPSAFCVSVRDENEQLPEYLEKALEFIACAQALESYGLYDSIPPDQVGYLPELPELLKGNLDVAFKTYCVRCTKDNGSVEFRIPWEKVNQALMYCGIFNTLLKPGLPETLTQDEFLALGHEASLMRLSNKQVLKIYNVFRKYQDAEQQVFRDDLIEIFRQAFVPNISEQEVNGISTVFDVDGSGSISAAEFCGIISRFMRRHEQDWNLLRGLRKVLGKSAKRQVTETAVITKEKILARAEKVGMKINESEAEEMMWCAACYCKLISAGQQGKMLDFCGLAAAVLLFVDLPYGKLPPRPVYNFEDVKEELKKKVARRALASTTGSRSVDSVGALRTKPKGGAGASNAANTLRPSQAAAKSEDRGKKAWRTKRGQTQEFEAQQKRAALLASGKAKFSQALHKIINVAADEAVKKSNMVVVTNVATEFVTDLRQMSAEDASKERFFRAKLDKVDFTEEEENEKRKGINLAAEIKQFGIPDTPDARIHQLLEDPDSSRAANLWSLFMGVVIICSVASIVIKHLTQPEEWKQSSTEKKIWKVLESGFTVIFMSELVVRFAVADALGTQTRCDFVKNPMNICDFASCLPFFIELCVGDSQQEMRLLRVARLLRLARVARIARLAKKGTIFGPAAAVFTIIWGIYLKESD